ncbi:MAG: hypothetical protein ACK54C_00110 [Betaproteobacteria bacterium]
MFVIIVGTPANDAGVQTVQGADRAGEGGVQTVPEGVQSLPLTPAQIAPEPSENHQRTIRGTVRKARAARGTRFALTELPAHWAEFCEEHRPDLKADAVFERFRDYWTALPGTKGVKLDWCATWRNWCRNERQDPLSKQANLEARNRRAVREWERRGVAAAIFGAGGSDIFSSDSGTGLIDVPPVEVIRG